MSHRQKEGTFMSNCYLDKLPPASDLDFRKDYESDKEYKFRKEGMEKKEIPIKRRSSHTILKKENDDVTPETRLTVEELSFSKFLKKEISESKNTSIIHEASKITINDYCDVSSKSLIYRRSPPLNGKPAGPSNLLFNSEVTINLVELRENFLSIARTSKLDYRNHRPDDLIFDSSFESGNLYEAHRVSDDEYDLVLQSDFNTMGYNQWFYFSVKNMKKGSVVKFNIINFLKTHPFLRSGVMKPCVFSEKAFLLNKTGWKRQAEQTQFFENGRIREKNGKVLSYFTFSWNFRFEHDSDLVYFSLNYPYTHSQLMNYLDKLHADNKNSPTIFLERTNLCESLTKKACPLITITSKKNGGDSTEHKKVAIITARQHPGETVSSFECEGFIDFITGSSADAIFLRENYIFKILPMMNPDGVYYGNFRCGLSGEDLNRRWLNPKKELHPTIYHCVQLIKSLIKEKGKIEYFIDLHGHSKKHDAFIYACLFTNEDQPYKTMIYPKLFSQINPFFNFGSCTFGLSKVKEKSGRGVIWKLLAQPNIFTLETSFFGYKDRSGREIAFTINDLTQIGRDAAKALFLYGSKYSRRDSIKGKKPSAVDNLIKEIQTNYNELKLNNQGAQDSGSETDPSADELEETEKLAFFTKSDLPAMRKPEPIPSNRKLNSKPRVASRGRILKAIAQAEIAQERLVNGKLKVDRACQTSFSYEETDTKDENKWMNGSVEGRGMTAKQKQEYVLKKIQFQGKSLKGIAALGTFVKYTDKKESSEKTDQYSDSALFRASGVIGLGSLSMKKKEGQNNIKASSIEELRAASLDKDHSDVEPREQYFINERGFLPKNGTPKAIMIRKLQTGKMIVTPRVTESLTPKNPSSEYFPNSLSMATKASIDVGLALSKRNIKERESIHAQREGFQKEDASLKKTPVKNTVRYHINLRVSDMVNVWRSNRKKFGGTFRLSAFSKSSNLI